MKLKGLSLRPDDTMKKLDSLEKLYDGSVDAADLEQGLDAEARDELRALLEAKAALDGLPKRSPSPTVLSAVEAAAAAHAAKRSRLGLLRSVPVIRFAAAAVVLVALGITYQAVTTSTQEGIVQTEHSQEAEIAGDDATTLRDNDALGREEEAPAAPQASREAARDLTADELVLSEEAPPASATLDARRFSLAESELMQHRIADSLALGPSLWEDETAFQTFYWQMQALSGRSPGDEWEEAVPLEGSFEAVEGSRANPGWLEANTER